ncbi:hypothetical protein [Chryseosolibacter indicus]|uniref:Uncharacterized protein n=1 Tax=Chryseosolibacter indicus TaxID=2782351 RepID=A0ABS5VKD7_9BACT|nr:hypothetical protein [Chryseosolibacter indicus]MBT1701910.1 hypothetical protein [Chryseosolibacter indicus]
MSKLQCKCGFVIHDYQVDIPYKGAIIPNGPFFDFFDKVQEGIESFVEATKQGRRKEWIEERLSGSTYSTDITDKQLMGEIFGQYYFDLRRLIYQCENCGRIWIQQNNSTAFVPFLPDADNWKNILFDDSEVE